MEPVPSYRQELPRWLTLHLPLFILVYPFLLMVPALNWEEGLYREYGLIENFTVSFLIASLVIYLRALRLSRRLLQRFWLAGLAFGSFLFCGEEISWGQHYFRWVTPEEFKELNRQGETNLHNLKGGVEYFFTKVAREGLSLGTIVGGFLLPVWFKRRGQVFARDSLHFWLWPSAACALTAVLSATVRLPNNIAHEFGAEHHLPPYLGHDIGEMKECYLALFILLYALGQFRGVSAAAGQPAATP
jgi:hypothetical protein